jgi:signal transduction histidine kinase
MHPDEATASEPTTRADPAALRLQTQDDFEFTPDGQVVTDARGLVLKANLAAASILRCPKEFLVGKPLGLFVVEGRRPRFYECLSRLGLGIASDQFETLVTHRTEPPRDVYVRVVATDGVGEGQDGPVFRWAFRDVSDQKRTEEERARLLRRIVTAHEDERRRVAREMHDSFGQLVTALTLSVRAARDSGPLPGPAEARLAEIQRLADELGRAARDLAVRLRPTALDDLGLHAALAQQIAEWSGRTGVEVDFEAATIEAVRLPSEIETTVYRMVQEALTNVARHANAGRVSVVVAILDSRVSVAVEDDGIGFDPEQAAGGLGLIGMRERVALVGGTLDIESVRDRGTTVLARFPLPGRGEGPIVWPNLTAGKNRPADAGGGAK